MDYLINQCLMLSCCEAYILVGRGRTSGFVQQQFPALLSSSPGTDAQWRGQTEISCTWDSTCLWAVQYRNLLGIEQTAVILGCELVWPHHMATGSDSLL